MVTPTQGTLTTAIGIAIADASAETAKAVVKLISHQHGTLSVIVGHRLRFRLRSAAVSQPRAGAPQHQGADCHQADAADRDCAPIGCKLDLHPGA